MLHQETNNQSNIERKLNNFKIITLKQERVSCVITRIAKVYNKKAIVVSRRTAKVGKTSMGRFWIKKCDTAMVPTGNYFAVDTLKELKKKYEE